jgi:hypothetical protein
MPSLTSKVPSLPVSSLWTVQLFPSTRKFEEQQWTPSRIYFHFKQALSPSMFHLPSSENPDATLKVIVPPALTECTALLLPYGIGDVKSVNARR